MTSQKPTNANTVPKDQVAETRRVPDDLMEKANGAIDEQVGGICNWQFAPRTRWLHQIVA